MLSSPHCWRTGLIWALCAGLLAACGSTPGSLPSRAGFPGEANVPDSTAAPAQDSASLPDASIDSMDRELFAATRAALENGDWLAATLALPQMETIANGSAENPPSAAPETDATSSLWIDYYKARIALLRGDTQSHEIALADLKSRRLPNDLQLELLSHELDLAGARHDSDAQLALSLQLLSLSTTSITANPVLADAIWSAAQQVSRSGATQRPESNTDTQAWLELAAANALDDALGSAAALAAWETQYPEHMARTHATALREAALQDAQTTKLTLVLPLSGPLAKAGEAVSRGFIAAFFASQEPGLSIDVLDSRRFDSVSDAYAEAQAKGANLIVGPLGKTQVQELLAKQDLAVPVLTLNRPEVIQQNNPSALLLSLAPEDEARQLATDAYAGGARRALLIRPEGEWGDRMETALAQQWRQLGGQLPTTAIYGKPNTHSNAVRDALGLGDSAKRSAALRSLFSERIETTGRRRDDLDSIFLLSKSSDEARALKPLINYHYAGELPVYSLSTADSGSGNTSLNRDLGGLRLLAMPWRLDESTLPGADSKSSSAALHALGADAYALARRWWRMRSTAAPMFFGLTAELRASPEGVLNRRLNLAEFNRGVLRPR
ncbi:penicillin-binding protein activator [Congregibacter variabilis]|uniref:Penicillin-binding protein activator n=1 Tax=Congregibacter variabilis TaxID=3081200 RepID=A0ABZ0I620_9GAMM|nr:penicillin-binding protein activator [Congregibacter sp. IMCC43200]